MPFDNKIKALQTPERVRVLCKLTQIGLYTRDELLTLVQPPRVQESQSVANDVLTFARKGRLVEEGEDKRFRSLISEDCISNPLLFRRTILQHARQDADLFFHKFTSWAFSHAEQVMVMKPEELEGSFYNDVSGRYTGKREYNGTINIRGWMTWVCYLGFGYEHNGYFLANPYQRIKEDLQFDASLERDKSMPFSVFMKWLSREIPELDGGVFFEQYCPKTELGHLSYALSTGLRTLHNHGIIQMRLVKDAKDVWLLTPSKLHEINHKVSEITICGDDKE